MSPMNDRSFVSFFLTVIPCISCLTALPQTVMVNRSGDSGQGKTFVYFPSLLPFSLLLYLFIWLHWVLVVTCRILSCGTRTLSCSKWDLVPWPGIELRPPGLGARSLSHWITREVPLYFLWIPWSLIFNLPSFLIHALKAMNFPLKSGFSCIPQILICHIFIIQFKFPTEISFLPHELF